MVLYRGLGLGRARRQGLENARSLPSQARKKKGQSPKLLP
jgi:hypothetical protein